MKRFLWFLLTMFGTAAAQADGRLYVAGGALSFEQVVERAVAQHPTPGRFFLLVIGPAVRGLSVTAPDELVEHRQRAAAQGAVFLVCQRDLDRQLFTMIDLVPGVNPVRGWPKAGEEEFVPGSLLYKDEDPAQLPPSAEALRRLRATCS